MKARARTALFSALNVAFAIQYGVALVFSILLGDHDPAPRRKISENDYAFN